MHCCCNAWFIACRLLADLSFEVAYCCLQLSVCAGCGVIAFLMSDLSYYSNSEKYPDTYLSSPLLPVALSLLVGYTVAQCFFNVGYLA